MSKTRQALGAELQATMFQSLDDEAFERLEETLIYADVGAPTTARIVERLEGEAAGGELTGGEDLTRRLRELLADTARLEGDTIPLSAAHGDPHDRASTGAARPPRSARWPGTSRRSWAARCCWPPATPSEPPRQSSSPPGRSGPAARSCAATSGSDPGAVVVRRPRGGRQSRGHDVVIVDTAGRLHTQQHLMDELRKIRKVIAGRVPGAPHETLLTIDATTGQNGLRQALLFREAVDVTGIALTKLDGTAKGGIALAIAQELGVPVKLIGIGEALEDLRPFDPDDFAQRDPRAVGPIGPAPRHRRHRIPRRRAAAPGGRPPARRHVSLEYPSRRTRGVGLDRARRARRGRRERPAGARAAECCGAHRLPAGGRGRARDHGGRGGRVAAAAAAVGARLVHLSSDVIFDGTKPSPYDESDAPSPITEYGRAKADAELAVAEAHPEALLARTSLIYGGGGAQSPRAARNRGGARRGRPRLLRRRAALPGAGARAGGGAARAARASRAGCPEPRRSRAW